MSKAYKIAAIVMSSALAFFFSWYMNCLIHSYVSPDIAEWVEDGVSALMIMMLLGAVGFFDRLFNCK
jgi:hypothetical protein